MSRKKNGNYQIFVASLGGGYPQFGNKQNFSFFSYEGFPNQEFEFGKVLFVLFYFTLA